MPQSDELTEKLQRARALFVENEDASFESTPVKRVADESEVEASTSSHPSRSPVPGQRIAKGSPCMSPGKSQFDEIMAWRKSVNDKSAETFESKEPAWFSEKGLPPTPTRARKSLFPPSLPPPPSPAPGQQRGGSSTLLAESCGTAQKLEESACHRIPESLGDDTVISTRYSHAEKDGALQEFQQEQNCDTFHAAGSSQSRVCSIGDTSSACHR